MHECTDTMAKEKIEATAVSLFLCKLSTITIG